MIVIRGTYYDGKTSKALPATLEIYRSGEVRLAGAAPGESVQLARIEIGERIGNTPRWLRFPHGGTFETLENDAIDAALARGGAQTWSRFLHVLESRKRYILAALFAVVVSSWAFFAHGVPALARGAAFALPAETSSAISAGTLDFLDRGFFSPSELDAATKTRIERRFAALTADRPGGFDYRLEFRKGGDMIGANAFALPSGTVVVTDELVALAEHDDEIVSVLAHEVGHVVHRHGLRRIIQDSMVGLAIVLVTGDASSTASMIAALPVLLVEAQYSQAFEREADRYALDYLVMHRLDPVHFKNLMLRMDRNADAESPVAAYLSTHPPTAERVRPFDGNPGKN